jgi:bifunctional non-homologous end joining protein LigD
MVNKENLKEYKQKRDFGKTPEPIGKEKPNKKEPIFVVQKHDASNLHYDFRIEIEGVLASWAVPKGPSTNASVKRLAIPTENHPMDYAKFEGVIPEGQYGAGKVLVWDYGTYKNMKDYSVAEAKRKGLIEIFLEGEKLKGGYSLVRMGREVKDAKWLLIKMQDEYANTRPDMLKNEPESVTSGKTLKDLN